MLERTSQFCGSEGWRRSEQTLQPKPVGHQTRQEEYRTYGENETVSLVGNRRIQSL